MGSLATMPFAISTYSTFDLLLVLKTVRHRLESNNQIRTYSGGSAPTVRSIFYQCGKSRARVYIVMYRIILNDNDPIIGCTVPKETL